MHGGGEGDLLHVRPFVRLLCFVCASTFYFITTIWVIVVVCSRTYIPSGQTDWLASQDRSCACLSICVKPGQIAIMYNSALRFERSSGKKKKRDNKKKRVEGSEFEKAFSFLRRGQRQAFKLCSSSAIIPERAT